MIQINISGKYLISLQHIREIGSDEFEGLFVPGAAKEPLEIRALSARLCLLEKLLQFSAP